MLTSKELRSGQRLRASDIQFLKEEMVGVWHNWDKVSVRNAKGHELFAWESRDDLIHEAKLVGGQLLVTLGAGVSVFAFQVFSFESQSWSPCFSLNTCDYAIAGVHPSLSRVAMRSDSLEIWDVALQEKIEAFEFEEVDVVAFGANTIAYSGYEGLLLATQPALTTRLKSSGNDEISALRWLGDEHLLIGYVSGLLSLFDITTKSERELMRCGSEIVRIDGSFHDSLVALSDSKNVHLLNVRSLKTRTINDSFGLCSNAQSSGVLTHSGISFIEPFESS